MIDGFRCPICTGTRAARLNTYKHVWDECTDCGNVFRTRKEEYLATKLVPRSLWSTINGTGVPVLRTIDKVLFPRLDVIDNPESIYTYYEDCIRKGVEKTKYAEESRTYDARFPQIGIDVTGKSILDVSGGPGFLAAHLAKRAKRVVMTEYDSNIVKLAREMLGIETVHYDFNKDEIDQLIEGKFDIALVRYAINFCLDPKRFLDSLRKVLNPGAWVYISFNLPSMGLCVRYQFDDYTCPILFNPETLTRMFAESGFTLKYREEEVNYPYRMQATLLHQVLYTPYMLAGRLSGFNQELVVKGRAHAYRLAS